MPLVPASCIDSGCLSSFIEAVHEVAAQTAGLEHIDVVEHPVRTGVSDPRDIVRYRLSQPQRALFLAELGNKERRRVVDECVAAVAELGEPFDPGVVLLAART